MTNLHRSTPFPYQKSW